MFKAKEISLKNAATVAVLIAAVAAGFYLSRPQMAVSRSVPVFWAEEVTVQKAIPAVRTSEIAQAAPLASAPAIPPAAVVPAPLIPPAITFKVLPLYPAGALAKGLEGTVLLSVYVGLGGQPEKIETKLSSGVSELDDAAAKAVAQWRFAPASRAGAALASWFEVPVRFMVK